MTETDYQKQLLFQKIAFNRKRCARELDTLKNSLSPLNTFLLVSKIVGRQLASLGAMLRSDGLAGSASRTTASRLVSWLQIGVLVLELWRGKRASVSKTREKAGEAVR